MKGKWVCPFLLFALPVGAAQELPTYPGAVHIRIGDDLVIGGEYFRIAYFTTSDSVSSVADYFFQAWKAMGYPTSADGYPDDEMVVSAFYTREGLQRSVVLRRRAGKTIGFAALRDLWVRSVPASEDGMFFAAEGGALIGDIETRDGRTQLHHRTALIESKLADVGSFIRRQLDSSGYVLAREAEFKRDGVRHLTFEHVRAERRIATALSDLEGNATAIVQTCFGCGREEGAVPH